MDMPSHGHPAYRCDGSPTGPGGTYQGHIGPGVLFVCWAAHTVFGSMRTWVQCQKKGVPYESQAHYNWPGLPAFPWESMMKLLAATVGSTFEMSLDHSDGFQYLTCKEGTTRAGHFNGDSVNNWQHFTMYWAFFLSGLVDLVGWWGLLPAGAEKAFLSLAFAGEGILMGLHEKHEPLDKYLHQALAGAMLASALFAAMEAARPSSYVASCARAGAVMMQGIILIMIGQVRYRDDLPAAWDISNGDLAPLFYSKVMVTQAIATVVAGYMALHILVDAVMRRKAGDEAISSSFLFQRV